MLISNDWVSGSEKDQETQEINVKYVVP